MTREYTPHEIEAMNLAADAEDDDGGGDGAEMLILLMFRTYHGPVAKPCADELRDFAEVLSVVRAYDGARRTE